MSTKETDSATGYVAGCPELPVDPVIEAYKKDVDRTLLRESLKLTVEQRLDDLMRLQEFAEELRKAPRSQP